MAFGLGVVMMVHPCPLTTNSAALLWLGGRSRSGREAVVLGVFYTLGLMLSYTVLGVLIVVGVQQTGLSQFLQTRMSLLMGPLLVLAGMLLVGWLRWPSWAGRFWQQRESVSRIGSLALGGAVALAFCPVTAALFFMVLMPAVIARGDYLLPAVFGAGCGVPLIAMAFLFGVARQRMQQRSAMFAKRQHLPARIAGVVLIMMGVFLTLRQVYGVL
jgi:cytochrome c biogenesis protein CcdA